MNSIVLMIAVLSSPLDEEGAAARAEDRSALLAAGRATVDGAKAIQLASRVGLVPEVELSFGYERIGGFETGGFPGPDGEVRAIDIPLNRWAARASVSYGLVSTLLGRLRAIDSLESVTTSRELELEATRLDVRFEAKRRFHLYVASVQTASVAGASLRLAQVQLDRVEARFDAGRATRADVAAARARLESRRAERVQAQAQKTNAATLLRTWIGVDDLSAVAPTRTWSRARRSPLVGKIDNLVAEAIRARPEGRALSSLEAAEHARASSFIAEIVPDVRVSATYLQANPNPNTIPPVAEWDDSYAVGAQIVWSLERALVGGARREEAVAASARLEALRADLNRRIAEETTTALADLEAALSVISAAKARIEASLTAFDARSAAFDAGRATLDELLDAELELARARLQSVEAAARHHIARARLERALGRPLPTS